MYEDRIAYLLRALEEGVEQRIKLVNETIRLRTEAISSDLDLRKQISTSKEKLKSCNNICAFINKTSVA